MYGSGMKLGEVIAYLKTQDPEHVAPVGLGEPHSWRGSYDELAFAPEEHVSVAEMLNNAQSAMGATFTGYKGGEFGMGKDTECHLAAHGRIGEPLGPVLLGYMCGNAKTEGVF